MARIHIEALGCRLNHAEAERMARGFTFAGHELVTSPEQADVRVVNTCTVTAAAGRDSRGAARRLHPAQRIVATGCHADRHPGDFAGADLVVPNSGKDDLAALVMERFGMEGFALGMAARAETHARLYPLALDTTRAFVKIQDGCNLRCSFCLTTLARGMSRSRDDGEILREISRLAAEGCQEAVLTGVHAGSYGLDLNRDLGWLVGRILEQTPIPRLRLSSLEPWNFRAEWTELWSRFPGRLCRHLHMSLQSGSRTVLRRMRRHYDPETFQEKLEATRRVPGMAVTTDLIAGFPGETEAEHLESLAFVCACAFAGAHIFPYSARPGTDAASMPDQVHGADRRRRHAELTAAVAETADAFLRALDGTEQDVLWEKPAADGTVTGHADVHATVTLRHGSVERNRITRVRVAYQDGRLVADAPAS